MGDREKVIKGLTAIQDEAYDRWVHRQYIEDTLVTLIKENIPDALALLKQYEESWKSVKHSVIDAQMNNAGKNGDKDVYRILKFVTNLMDLQEKKWKDA